MEEEQLGIIDSAYEVIIDILMLFYTLAELISDL